MNTSSKDILTKLRNSPLYREYERAFQDGLHMPITLRPVETWGLPLHECRYENPFCALIASDRKACTKCLETQQDLNGGEEDEPKTITCFAGFHETVVPIRHGDTLIGYLQTGQIRTRSATRKSFNAVYRRLTQWGSRIDRKKLNEAYHASPAMEPETYRSRIALLKQFAQHLETLVNQIVVRNEHPEPPVIERARAFIEKNFAEEISLKQAAMAVNTSTFYFCKVFKKSTGLTFTEYLARIRIEKAKEMLLDPYARISEVAFAVGFQSLSQFNRTFKKITGRSPSAYRRKYPSELVA